MSEEILVKCILCSEEQTERLCLTCLQQFSPLSVVQDHSWRDWETIVRASGLQIDRERFETLTRLATDRVSET